MKRYYILKDNKIVETETSRKRSLAKIRELQTLETHYLLRANFELLTHDPAIVPPEVSPHPNCWHIFDGDTLRMDVCHWKDAEYEMHGENGRLQNPYCIFGKLEVVKYKR